jgi:transposase/transcriptional regulator with XRE-family HTH domain
MGRLTGVMIGATMRHLGMSQPRLAAASGVSLSTIARILSDPGIPIRSRDVEIRLRSFFESIGVEFLDRTADVTNARWMPPEKRKHKGPRKKREMSEETRRRIDQMHSEILRLTERGHTQPWIADALGISTGTINRVCKMHGVQSAHDADLEKRRSVAAGVLASGGSLSEATSQSGLSRKTARRVAASMGIDVSRQRKARRPAPQQLNEQKEARDIEIYERRKAGESLKSIGKSFGMTSEGVRQICKRKFKMPTKHIRRRLPDGTLVPSKAALAAGEV